MHYKINFHFTDKCDMACKHCFGLINKTEPEKILEVFKKIKYLTNSVNLAGGEVFLDIDLLYSIIKQSVLDKLNISIVTNGLKLLNHLEDERIIYILKHIYQLGISIDSFDDKTNQIIGRKTLDLNKLKKLSNICKDNHVQLKINTVVTQVNMSDIMVDKINTLFPDIWKIIQVYSNDNHIMISMDQFQSFIENNKSDAFKIKEEISNGITCSYVMINGLGQLYLNSDIINGFYLIEFVEQNRKMSSKQFEIILNENGFSSEKYNMRYQNDNKSIKFDLSKFYKKQKNRFNDGSNILFLDVEGITPREYQTNKYKQLSMCFKPVLYTGEIINENHEHLNTIKGYLKPQDFIISKMMSDDKRVLSVFYKEAARSIIDSKIGLVVSSAGESEQLFFQEMIYYGNLSRKDYEYISDLMNNIFDIQMIAREGILEIESNVQASRRVLEYLHNYKSDLFPYIRNGEKDSDSSFSVSKELSKIYLEPLKFTSEQILEKLDKYTHYCLEDVFDDYKLFKTYHSMKNLQELLA